MLLSKLIMQIFYLIAFLVIDGPVFKPPPPRVCVRQIMYTLAANNFDPFVLKLMVNLRRRESVKYDAIVSILVTCDVMSWRRSSRPNDSVEILRLRSPNFRIINEP